MVVDAQGRPAERPMGAGPRGRSSDLNELSDNSRHGDSLLMSLGDAAVLAPSSNRLRLRRASPEASDTGFSPLSAGNLVRPMILSGQ